VTPLVPCTCITAHDRAVCVGWCGANVTRAPFESQVIHACKPDDDDQRPLCGETPEASFVADEGSQLKPGFRWCGACLRAGNDIALLPPSEASVTYAYVRAEQEADLKCDQVRLANDGATVEVMREKLAEVGIELGPELFDGGRVFFYTDLHGKKRKLRARKLSLR